MRHIERTWGGVFSLLVVGGAVTAWASEPAVEEARPLEYCVWTANCSRSLHCAKRFATAREAAEFAWDAREKKTKFVAIFHGEANWSHAFRVFAPRRTGDASPPKLVCSVITRFCRVGWVHQPGGTELTREAAVARVEDLRKQGTPAEVIYHLPNPPGANEVSKSTAPSGG